MASSSRLASTGKYALEGTKISIDFIAKLADGLPIPVKGALAAAQAIIALVESIKANEAETKSLTDRTLRILLVVVTSARSLSKATDEEEPRLTPDLEYKVNALAENLEFILKDLKKLKKKTKPEGWKGLIVSGVSAKDNTEQLQKLNLRLDREMNVFQVDVQLNDAIRLVQVADTVAAVADGVATVTQDVKTMAGHVLTVSQHAAITSNSIMSVLENVAVVSNQIVAMQKEVRAAQAAAPGMPIEDVPDVRLVWRMPRARSHSYSSSNRPFTPSGCFEGTRTQLLEEITTWAADTNLTSSRVYCLNGIAGVGKTAIARTVTEWAQTRGILGGDFFFCRDGGEELKDSRLLFPTIAYQLCRLDEGFARHLAAGLEDDPDLPYGCIRDQLQKLIVKPLSQLNTYSTRPILLVIDGLDECDFRDAKRILQGIEEDVAAIPFLLKILITTRPEGHIRYTLKSSKTIRTTTLHNIDPSVVKADIRHWLSKCLANIPNDLDTPEERGRDWITDGEVDILAEKSGILPMVAAELIWFIGDERVVDPRGRLDILLGAAASDGENPYPELNSMYLYVLQNLVPKFGPGPCLERLRAVLGAMCLLRAPLPSAALERLLGLPKHIVLLTLRNLHSVIFVPDDPNEAARFYHQSFCDFIQNPTHCSDSRFLINTEEHEDRLASSCLQLLNRSLEGAMFERTTSSVFTQDNLSNPNRKVKRTPSHGLNYACRYWATHLSKGRAENDELLKSLDDFAFRCMMWWLEALFLLGDIGLAHEALHAAKEWVIRSPETARLISILEDASDAINADRLSLISSHQQIRKAAFFTKGTVLYETYFDQAERDEDASQEQEADGVQSTGQTREVGTPANGKLSRIRRWFKSSIKNHSGDFAITTSRLQVPHPRV